MSEDVDKLVLKRYDIHQKLGKGAYGVVWRAVDRKSREVVAVKKIFDAFQNSTDSQRTFREVVFLHELAHHDSIITLLNVMRPSTTNNRDLYLVFEFMDTDLHTAIRSKILLPVHRRYIIYQLIKTLKYLHNCKILHRDMKPSNVLIDSKCNIKIADFGLARLIKGNNNTNRNYVKSKSKIGEGIDAIGDNNISTLTDYVATRWYRAPEILLGSHSYSFAVDMWSVGCIIGEMITCKPLFPGNSTTNQIQRIVDVTGKPTQAEVDTIKSQYARSMLEGFIDVRVARPIENHRNHHRHDHHGEHALGINNRKNHDATGGSNNSSSSSSSSSNLVTKLMKKVTLSSSKYTTKSGGSSGSNANVDTFKVNNKYNSRLNRLFPKALPEEIDLMSRLLRFSPVDRLTAPQSLKHSYVTQFSPKIQPKDLNVAFSKSDGNCSEDDSDEDRCDHEIVMPFDDDVKFSTSQYREKLYAEIEVRSKEAKKRLKERQIK